MQNKILRKGLVVGIIILFVGVSVLSSASSKDVSVSNDKVDDDNNEIKPLDNQIEIISYITGFAFDVDKIGFIYDEPIEISAYKMSINIFGIKHSSTYLYDIFFNVGSVEYVKASRFFGRVNDNWTPPKVSGFAIGNIEWS